MDIVEKHKIIQKNDDSLVMDLKLATVIFVTLDKGIG